MSIQWLSCLGRNLLSRDLQLLCPRVHYATRIRVRAPVLRDHSHVMRYRCTRWSSSQQSLKCWNCDREIPLSEQESAKFLCPCDKQVVLPPTTRNYFIIMGCPISFKVDLNYLKETYKQLQRVLHPDRFTTKTSIEQDYSAQQSSLVNKAYTTLLKPYSRGLYLLRLHGLTIDEKDNTGTDPQFLAQMMEVNEEIYETEPSNQRLKEIRDLNNNNLQNCMKKVEKFFSEGNYSGAKEGLARMKYFVNIEEELLQRVDIE